MKVAGFISRPEGAKKRNYQQFLFVNGRYMRHPYFHKAVMSSYGQLIPADTQPTYFLNFTVDPETIDVNIHPTKTEIKFENELPIWQILSAAVKETLGKFIAVPTIDFNAADEDVPQIPAYNSNLAAGNNSPLAPVINHTKGYNPFNVGDGASHRHSLPQTDWKELYANFEKNKRDSLETQGNEDLEDVITVSSSMDTSGSSSSAQLPINKIEQVSGQQYIQLQNRYIVSQVQSGLMVIDQHRAHTLVLYERYLAQISNHTIAAQNILFPDVLHLSPAQSVVLDSVLKPMENIGFNLSKLSGNDWAINSVPSGVGDLDAKDTVMQVIEAVENGTSTASDKIHQKLALTVAHHGAVPYGRKMTNEEMDNLTAQLLSLPNPNYTPDGKTVMAIIANSNIEKLF